MAVVTRVNGDAAGVNNVGTGRAFANASIINTGIASPITAYKVAMTNGNLAAELTAGGAVETIIRAISANATVLASQVDTGNQLSVIVERSSWTDAILQTAIQGLNGGSAGNIGATGNVWVGGGVAVTSTGGIKLA